MLLFFTKWRFVVTLFWASLLAQFFQQCLLSSCVGHILVILPILRTFKLLIYLFWWSATSYASCYYYKYFGVSCVLTVPPTSRSPVSLPLLWSSYSLRHSSIYIRLIDNPTMASKCSSERKSCMSLTLNQKLGNIMLSEEGMSKAVKGQELGLLCQPNPEEGPISSI